MFDNKRNLCYSITNTNMHICHHACVCLVLSILKFICIYDIFFFFLNYIHSLIHLRTLITKYLLFLFVHFQEFWGEMFEMLSRNFSLRLGTSCSRLGFPFSLFCLRSVRTSIINRRTICAYGRQGLM